MIVGMNATVLDEAEIGDDVIIAAGAVVSPRTKIPSNTMVMGVPGKVLRELKPEERKHIIESAEWYINKFCK